MVGSVGAGGGGGNGLGRGGGWRRWNRMDTGADDCVDLIELNWVDLIE